MTQEITRKQVWVSLPIEESDRAPALFEGDSYIVELSSGEQLWANYTSHGGFVPCDDEGNEIASPGYSCPMPLDNVARVMVRGFTPGFGPSCPKAGEASKIHLVVISPTADEIIAAAEAARAKLGPRYHAEALLSDSEPLFSAERDTREWDRFEARNRALPADQQVD